MKTNSEYLIGYLAGVIKQFVFILPKMSGYVKTFQGGDKNNKMMSFRIDDNNIKKKTNHSD